MESEAPSLFYRGLRPTQTVEARILCFFEEQYAGIEKGLGLVVAGVKTRLGVGLFCAENRVRGRLLDVLR